LSYNNLSSVSKTLANLIWNGIKDDKQLNQIIKNIEQISYSAPNDSDKTAQLSIYLYDPTELPAMRNTPQAGNEPQTLLYLKLHYLITPLTRNPVTDQVILGKVMQLLANKPILRESDLLDSLAKTQSELRIILEAPSAEDQNRLWCMLQIPYKLSVSYGVYPVQIKADSNQKVVSTKNTVLAAATAAKIA
jgi:hypothetical protein